MPILKGKLSSYYGDTAEFAVILDLMKKGWEPFFHMNKRTMVDLMTFDPIEKRGITYQIKTLVTGGGQCDRKKGVMEPRPVIRKRQWLNTYTTQGKYSDYNIDYLVGVLPAPKNSNEYAKEIYYYPLDVYKNFKRINIETVSSVEHPEHPDFQDIYQEIPNLEEFLIDKSPVVQLVEQAAVNR